MKGNRTATNDLGRTERGLVQYTGTIYPTDGEKTHFLKQKKTIFQKQGFYHFFTRGLHQIS